MVASRKRPSARLLLVSSAAVLVILVSGLVYFHKMEMTVADVV